MIEAKGQFAQGDILFTPVDEIPAGFDKHSSKDEHIVAHSETGHHHVVNAQTCDLYQSANDPFVAYLHVHESTELRHLRSFDTHQTVLIPPGIWRINRQGEQTPEGWRRVAD